MGQNYKKPITEHLMLSIFWPEEQTLFDSRENLTITSPATISPGLILRRLVRISRAPEKNLIAQSVWETMSALLMNKYLPVSPSNSIETYGIISLKFLVSLSSLSSSDMRSDLTSFISY
jgi:hypothetical protein